MQHSKSVLLVVACGALALIPCGTAAWAESTTSTAGATVAKVLADMPVIDGHNDLPWEIRERFASNLDAVDLKHNTALLPRAADAGGEQTPLMTDIPRLRSGGVGAQFWSVWVPTDSKDATAVQLTIEQIDLVKRMTAHYPGDFEMAYTAADIVRIEHARKIASLIGVEITRPGKSVDKPCVTLNAPP